MKKENVKTKKGNIKMKKGRYAKFLAVAVTIALAFTLISCGGQSQNAGATTAAPATAAAAAETTQAATTAAETTKAAEPETTKAADTGGGGSAGDLEPITIKTGVMIAPVNEEYGILEDPVSLYIREKFGITIDAINANDSSDWVTRMNALIASNDLPDIFAVNDIKQLPMLINAKQIMALDDYITPEKTPTLATDPKCLAAHILHRMRNDDGKLYTIGMCRGTWDGGFGTLSGDYIRWDLYKALGYPAIGSYDDLLSVLYDMQEAYPTNADGQKCYAIGTWFGDSLGWGDWSIQYARTFSTGEMMMTADRTITADISTNKVSESNQLKNPNGVFWETMRFYNKAFQMGILDPESFTQKYDMYNEKVNAARYYYINPRWIAEGAQGEYDNNGMPEIGFAQLPDVSQIRKQALLSNMPAGERSIGVSARTAHPERIMALLDWLASYEGSRIAINGVQGVYWDMVDGKPDPKPELYDSTIKGDEKKAKGGVYIYSHVKGYADGTIDPQFDQPLTLVYTPKAQESTLSMVKKDQMEHYGVDSLFKVYAQNLDFYENNLAIVFTSLPDDLQSYATNLEDYMFKNVFKIIMAKSDDEFVKMRTQFMSDVDQFNADGIFKYWYDQAQAQNEKLEQVYKLLAK